MKTRQPIKKNKSWNIPNQNFRGGTNILINLYQQQSMPRPRRPNLIRQNANNLTTYRRNQILQAAGFNSLAQARSAFAPAPRRTRVTRPRPTLSDNQVYDRLITRWNSSVRQQQDRRAASQREIRAQDRDMRQRMITYNNTTLTPGGSYSDATTR